MATADIIAALGPTIRRKRDDLVIPTAEALASAEVIGLFSSHMSQEASQNATERLTSVLLETNAAGGGSGSAGAAAAGARFVVVVLPQDVAPSTSAILEGVVGAYVPDLDKAGLHVAEVAIRRRLRLSMAVKLPELVLLDVPSGRVLSTTAAESVMDGGVLIPERFPSGWRHNVFALRPPSAVVGSTARLAPAAMLRCGLFPGDPVTVRSLSTGATLCLQAGGADPDADADAARHGAEGAGQALAPAADDDIVLPAAVMAALGAAEGTDVAVERSAEPDTADGVTVMRLPQAGAAAGGAAESKAGEVVAAPGEGGVAALAASHYGLARSDAEGVVAGAIESALAASGGGGGSADGAGAAAASAAAGEDSGEARASLEGLLGAGGLPTWLLEHVRRSDCKHRLATPGQVVLVPVEGAEAGQAPAVVAAAACAAPTPAERVRALVAATAGSYRGFVVTAIRPKDFCLRVGADTKIVE